jgi:hypothetical protein
MVPNNFLLVYISFLFHSLNFINFSFDLLSRPPLWSGGQFLAANLEVPGSIPGATRFSE